MDPMEIERKQQLSAFIQGESFSISLWQVFWIVYVSPFLRLICFKFSQLEHLFHPRKLTWIPKIYGNLWKEIHVKKNIILGIYVGFRGGGVGLLASFDLNNHQASSCCSMRRLRHAATAAWKGAKKTPWLRWVPVPSGRIFNLKLEDPPETLI